MHFSRQNLRKDWGNCAGPPPFVWRANRPLVWTDGAVLRRPWECRCWVCGYPKGKCWAPICRALYLSGLWRTVESGPVIHFSFEGVVGRVVVQIDQFGKTQRCYLCHQDAIAEISADISAYLFVYFLGRDRVKESIQSYSSSSSRYCRCWLVAMIQIIIIDLRHS